MNLMQKATLRLATMSLGVLVTLPILATHSFAWSLQKGTETLSSYDVLSGARSSGFRRVNATVGKLNDGGVKQFPVRLKLNKGYNFLAVCDGSCDDITLELLNSQGTIIATGQPISSILPNGNGSGPDITGQVLLLSPLAAPSVASQANYTIRITMGTCASSEPCSFALGQYTR